MYLEINHGLYFQTPKTPAMLCIAITVLTRRINICKKCAIFDELYYVFEAEFLIYLLCHIFRLDFYLVDLVHFCTVIFPQPHMKSLASILSMVSATPPGVSDDPSRFFYLIFCFNIFIPQLPLSIFLDSKTNRCRHHNYTTAVRTPSEFPFCHVHFCSFVFGFSK